MIYKKIIFVWILFNNCLAHTQTITEVLQKISNQYSTAQPLQYRCNYVLYKDFETKKVEESYKGFFCKNAKNEVYMKIGNTETINAKTVFLKINHDERIIEISDPIAGTLGDFDMKKLLNLCTVEKFVAYKSYWEIILEAKPYSGLSYSKITVQISKDYFLQKQTFYYNTAINFSKDYRSRDSNYPRLEIAYTNYNRNPVSATIFNSTTYFSTSGKQQVILPEPLKKYKIIDQRKNSNK